MQVVRGFIVRVIYKNFQANEDNESIDRILYIIRIGSPDIAIYYSFKSRRYYVFDLIDNVLYITDNPTEIIQKKAKEFANDETAYIDLSPKYIHLISFNKIESK